MGACISALECDSMALLLLKHQHITCLQNSITLPNTGISEKRRQLNVTENFWWTKEDPHCVYPVMNSLRAPMATIEEIVTNKSMARISGLPMCLKTLPLCCFFFYCTFMQSFLHIEKAFSPLSASS